VYDVDTDRPRRGCSRQTYDAGSPPRTWLMVTINVKPNRPEIKPATRPPHKVRETHRYYTSRFAGRTSIYSAGSRGIPE
jgi:hypothetical protein